MQQKESMAGVHVRSVEANIEQIEWRSCKWPHTHMLGEREMTVAVEAADCFQNSSSILASQKQ